MNSILWPGFTPRQKINHIHNPQERKDANDLAVIVLMVRKWQKFSLFLVAIITMLTTLRKCHHYAQRTGLVLTCSTRHGPWGELHLSACMHTCLEYLNQEIPDSEGCLMEILRFWASFIKPRLKKMLPLVFVFHLIYFWVLLFQHKASFFCLTIMLKIMPA